MNPKMNTKWLRSMSCILCALGIGLSVHLYKSGSKAQVEKYTAEFDAEAARSLLLIQARMDAYCSDANLLQAWVSIPTNFTPHWEDFKAFANVILASRVGINAVSYNPRLTSETVAMHQAKYQTEIARMNFMQRVPNSTKLVPTNFLIYQSGGKSVLTVPLRDYYFVVTYIEPYETNANALGFELASNPTRQEALLLAQDTGKLVATEQIRLIQETGVQPGILLFAPFYNTTGLPALNLSCTTWQAKFESVEWRRANILGTTSLVLRVGDMINSILDDSNLDVFVFEVKNDKTLAFLCSGATGRDCL